MLSSITFHESRKKRTATRCMRILGLHECKIGPGPQAGERIIRREGKSVLFESKSGGYGVFAPEYGTFYTNNLNEAGKHFSKTLSPRVKKPAQSHGELYTEGQDVRAYRANDRSKAK
jgi:hypothetical protein